MKSIKSLLAVSLTTLSLIAVAADKPADKPAEAKPAATATTAPAEKQAEAPKKKALTPKDKAAKKDAGEPAKK
jgi:hypothetical protein